MATTPKNKAKLKKSVTPFEPFRLLLANTFGDNVAHMARSIGVSHTALSRVISGQQPPSSIMLQGLARLGSIDLNWVLGASEEGQWSTSFPSGRMAPLATELLPGPPADHSHLLQSVGLPIASFTLIRAAYWYCVPGGSAIASAGERAIRPGDFLLVDTGSTWSKWPKGLAGRLVVLRDADEQLAVPAQVGGEPNPYGEVGEFVLDTFGFREKANLLSSFTRAAMKANRIKLSQRDTTVKDFYADDVVGVVVQKLTVYGPK